MTTSSALVATYVDNKDHQRKSANGKTYVKLNMNAFYICEFPLWIEVAHVLVVVVDRAKELQRMYTFIPGVDIEQTQVNGTLTRNTSFFSSTLIVH
jgi:hypothetical protein